LNRRARLGRSTNYRVLSSTDYWVSRSIDGADRGYESLQLCFDGLGVVGSRQVALRDHEAAQLIEHQEEIAVSLVDAANGAPFESRCALHALHHQGVTVDHVRLVPEPGIRNWGRASL